MQIYIYYCCAVLCCVFASSCFPFYCRENLLLLSSFYGVNKHHSRSNIKFIPTPRISFPLLVFICSFDSIFDLMRIRIPAEVSINTSTTAKGGGCFCNTAIFLFAGPCGDQFFDIVLYLGFDFVEITVPLNQRMVVYGSGGG